MDRHAGSARLDYAELLARLVLVSIQLQLAGLAPAGGILPPLQQAARDVQELLKRKHRCIVCVCKSPLHMQPELA